MKKTWTPNYTLNWWEKMVYGLIYGFVVLFSLQPFWLVYRVSDLLYLLISCIGYRSAVIEKNLRNSFPEKTDKELKEIKQRFYHYFCDYIVETLKLATMSQKTMKKRVSYEGIEHIMHAVQDGKGVAGYIGHYCNWEWVTSIGLQLPEDTCVLQVYHVIESKVIDKLMLKLRSRMNTVNVPMSEIMRRIIKEKQNGRQPVIGFISDQSPIIYSNPYWTTFLHQKTPFINGTERLAKRLDLVPVYLDISRQKRGYYNIKIVELGSDIQSQPDWEITERYARELEKTIQRQPELWLWSHNRWKRSESDFVGQKRK